MQLFAFPSKNERNIRLGVEARLWAVAPARNKSFEAGRRTKARAMRAGAVGLLYCAERQSFTAPFLVESAPDPDKAVADIWPEEWVLPFGIRPVGSHRTVHMDDAKRRWSFLSELCRWKSPSVSAAMNMTGTTAFVPIDIEAQDWDQIVGDLA